jgi:hypothetical protein
VCLSTHARIQLYLCMKFSDQVRQEHAGENSIKQWYKNSGVTGRACASQNAQDDRAVRRRVMEGGLSTQPPEDHWQSKSRAGFPTTYPVANFSQTPAGEAIQATVTAGCNQ